MTEISTEPTAFPARAAADVHDAVDLPDVVAPGDHDLGSPAGATSPGATGAALGSLGLRVSRLADAIAARPELDRVADPVAAFVRQRLGQGRARDLLAGTWLGHGAHPMFTDIPIGSFTSASVLDLIGGRRSRKAANRLALLGVVSAVPTVASGAADWSTTAPRARRIGLVHASANVVGIVLYTKTLGQRRRGHGLRAAVTGLAGMTVMTAGGLLGGHLLAAERVGVNAAGDLPDDWTPLSPGVLPAPRQVIPARAGDAEVVLCARPDGQVAALADRCSHAGGPLHAGAFDADRSCVTCPWHGSRFRLDDGAVLAGPASVPQPVLEVTVASGRPEVRARR